MIGYRKKWKKNVFSESKKGRVVALRHEIHSQTDTSISVLNKNLISVVKDHPRLSIPLKISSLSCFNYIMEDKKIDWIISWVYK